LVAARLARTRRCERDAWRRCRDLLLRRAGPAFARDHGGGGLLFGALERDAGLKTRDDQIRERLALARQAGNARCGHAVGYWREYVNA